MRKTVFSLILGLAFVSATDARVSDSAVFPISDGGGPSRVSGSDVAPATDGAGPTGAHALIASIHAGIGEGGPKSVGRPVGDGGGPTRVFGASQAEMWRLAVGDCDGSRKSFLPEGGGGGPRWFESAFPVNQCGEPIRASAVSVRASGGGGGPKRQGLPVGDGGGPSRLFQEFAWV